VSVRSRRAASNLAVIAPLLSLAGVVLAGWAEFSKTAPFDGSYEWLNVATAFSGPTQFQSYVADLGIRVSHLTTLLMLCAIAISLAVVVWSRAGSRGEPSPARYFALLTLLLLYQAVYEVGRYVSLERLVQESSETYYEALRAAGIGWHTDEHDITPWLDYFLGIIAAAYKEFESRVGVVAVRGSKREAIRQFVRQSIADEFTVADLRRAAPAASQSYISKTLASMRDEGLIAPVGAGKSARWRRIRSAF